MVEALLKIQEKWQIGVIDFWNDERINSVSPEKRKLYLQDPIHPMKAGYAEWLVPVMEQRIAEYLEPQVSQKGKKNTFVVSLVEDSAKVFFYCAALNGAGGSGCCAEEIVFSVLSVTFRFLRIRNCLKMPRMAS